MNLSLNEIAQRMGGEISGNQVKCPGPGHSFKDRSVTIKVEPLAPGGLVVYSHAQDDNLKCKDYVLQKLGLEPFRPRPKANGTNGGTSRRFIKAYDYKDSDGTLLYQVVRYAPKGFAHRVPDGQNGWTYKGSEKRVLYRWPELIKYPDATAFVCEGEKDADRVAGLGLCATTVASGKWTPDCITALKGRDVLILEDNDEAGRVKAEESAKALHAVAKSIRMVRLPGLAHAEDVSDWLEAPQNTKEEFERIAFDAALWTPPQDINRPVLQSSAEFTRNYVPPDYLIDKLLQRRYCYSLTVRTGSGKTAITLCLAAHVALGRPLGEKEVEQGRVLMFAGENADDVCARWIALGHYMDFDVNTIDVHFVPGRFVIADLITKIRTEVEKLGGCALLIIDTSAAYFSGDDENDNVQLGQHASALRNLGIPGGPCTLINCHPPKNTTDDNLLPRGGGAFLAEVDGNLTAIKNEMAIKVHWQGKFRGLEFDPINFQLKAVTSDRLKDAKGRSIWTVYAKYLSDEAEEQIAASARRDEDALLSNLIAHGHGSVAALAQRMGWFTNKGDPQKSKVHGVLASLKKAKLVRSDRNRLVVTELGLKTIKASNGAVNDETNDNGAND
jgi:AAA domain